MIRTVLSVSILAAVVACSTDNKQTPRTVQCTASSQCGINQACENGLCISPNTSSPIQQDPAPAAQQPVDSVPAAPTSLLVRCNPAAPASPILNFNGAASSYAVYQSAVPFTDKSKATRTTVNTSSAPFAADLASPKYIRVAAINGSAESELSEQIVIDARQRIGFIEANEGRWDLKIVPLTGGSAITVNFGSGLNPNRGVNFFSWSPDGTRLAYVSDQEVDEKFELYIAGPDFSQAPVKRSITLAAEEDVSTHRIWWSPNGKDLLYRAGNAVDVLDLFKVKVDTGENTRLVQSSNKKWVHRFQWTPDGTKIVFHGDLEVDDRDELYTINADGTHLTKLVAATASEEVLHTTFEISPNGERVLFAFGKSDGTEQRFYTMPMAGGDKVAVSPLLTNAAGVQHIAQWSPNGAKIAYLGNNAGGATERLYVTDANANAPTLVSATLERTKPSLASDEFVDSFYWSPDGEELLFRVRESNAGYNLYAGETAEYATKRAITKQSPPFWPSLGGFSPDGTRLLYMTDVSVNDHFELFVSGTASPLVALPDGHSIPWQPYGEFQPAPYCFSTTTNLRY